MKATRAERFVSVALDHLACGVEVRRQELADLLGVAILGERREPDEIAEEHRDKSPLRLRRGGGRLTGERGATFAAEAVLRLVRRPARRAGEGERRAAVGAKLPARAILASAG